MLSPELHQELELLYKEFNLSSMTPEEQGIFILELGRLAHDRYQQRLDQAVRRGEAVVLSYADHVRELVHELRGVR